MKLETDRLVLRSWEARDLEPLAQILADPEVRRFYPKPLTLEETRTQLDFARARQADTGFHFGAAELKETGRFIGLVGIGRIGEPLRSALRGHPEVEIGWQFDRAVWGQGLAPEAARAWLAYGFETLQLPEIVAFTFTGNRPSQRVMEKLGMTRDPADDFEHPNLAPGHPLRPHVLYRLAHTSSTGSPGRPSRERRQSGPFSPSGRRWRAAPDEGSGAPAASSAALPRTARLHQHRRP